LRASGRRSELPRRRGGGGRIAGAALAVSALLLAVALPGGEPPRPCAAAWEGVATQGWTRVAVCGDPRGRPPLRGPVRRLFGLPLDPNSAEPRTLESLPGIGPARAAAIVRERERRPYASVADLRRVSGIGPVLLGRIAPHLAVSPQARGWPSSETGSLPRPVERSREDRS
jgi:hypothetical protein